MELTFIGAGAIGGTLAAHMSRAGHSITVCDVDVQHVEAINRHGLIIEGPVENFVAHPRAITPDELPDHIEHIAVAVKSHHTEHAARLIEGRVAPGGYVVSFQNGLTSDILADAVGEENLLASFVNFGADVIEPGRIMQGNIGAFFVGELPSGVVTPRVRDLVAALPYAQATDNVRGYLWGKEAYGAMLYAGAVSDLAIADSLSDPTYRPLMVAIAREVLAQAPVPVKGFDGFDPDDLEGSLERLAAFNRGSAKTHSGIYRDLMIRHRKTEVDDLLRDLSGPLTTLTGRLIQAIERGERTCEVANLDLLATYERTLRLGAPLHAIVRVIDAPRRALSGPLHNVAIAVKDLIDIEGLPRGNGNPSDMLGPPATKDAPVIARLRDLGADVYVTTTLLEYAAGALHPEVPEALNPKDPSTTAGGSSGGSAALVGAGACAVALGTDTGGSIRIPAHYVGCVGLKPTYGLLSLEGVQPLSPSLDHVGLLADSCATATRVLAALIDEKVPDELVGARLGVARDLFNDPVIRPDVSQALESALEECSKIVDLVEVDTTPWIEIRETFEDIILFEAWRVHAAHVERAPDDFGPETLRLLLGARDVTRERYERALARRDSLMSACDALYDGLDAILTPATPFVAPATTPPIDTAEGAEEALFTSIFNLTGDPAVVIPAGRGESNLPVGIQLSSARGRDLHLLATADLLARHLSL